MNDFIYFLLDKNRTSPPPPPQESSWDLVIRLPYNCSGYRMHSKDDPEGDPLGDLVGVIFVDTVDHNPLFIKQ